LPRSIKQHALLSTAVFGSLIVALLLVGTLAFYRLEAIADAAEQADASQRILRTVDRAISQLADAEAGVRGYLLTRNASFGETIAVSLGRAEMESDQLVALAADDVDRRRDADELQSLLSLRLAEIRRDVERIEHGHDDAVHAPIQSGAVTDAMTAIRVVADRIRAEEKIRLSTLDRKREVARDASVAVFSLILVIALGMGCLAIVNVIDSARRARRVEEAMTELAAAQRTVVEREREMVALANSMPQLVWAANARGDHDYFNRRWYDYTGMAPDAPASEWRSFLHPDDVEHTMKVWTCCARNGEPYQIEYRLRRADGSYRWFMGRAVPLRDSAGRVVRWFGTSTDIEQEKAHAAERDGILESERIARSEAERANRLKDEFVAIVSHELRTPLNAVLGWVRLLRKDPTDESLEQGLEVIQRNAEAQARLVDDLLDTSRAMAGKLRLEVRPVDFATLVTEAVETIRPAADAKKVDLEIEIDRSPSPITADPNRLRQVTWNLVSNAIKFTPRGGRVRVALAWKPDRLRLTVADTGQGIAPEFLPHVFERFTQADGSTTRRHHGLGLGLTVVRQLVELHGGTVAVESDGEGCGACFTVDLPTSSAPRDTATRAGDSAVGHDALLAGADILIVDDDRDARELVARVLREYGARTRAAASVAEAIELYTAARPTAIVSDIGMPDEDGIDLIRRVRDIEAGSACPTPAAALSALSRPRDRERSLAAGFDVHIAKPVEPEQLADTLVGLIERGATRSTNGSAPRRTGE